MQKIPLLLAYKMYLCKKRKSQFVLLCLVKYLYKYIFIDRK